MVFALMLWMDEFIGLLLAQVFYGTFMATEVAYYTYIYAKVERSKYQIVTGHTRSAILVGRFLGAVFAQFLVTFQLMNFRELNYLSFGCKHEFFDFFSISRFNCSFSTFSLCVPISAMYFIGLVAALTVRRCQFVFLQSEKPTARRQRHR